MVAKGEHVLADPSSMPRSITIDAARYASLTRGLMITLVSSAHGSRRLGVLAVIGLVVGRLGGSWVLGGALAVAAVIIQLAYWRLRLGRTMQRGLGIGQRVTVDYTDSGELSVVDVTGQIWLARGSALMVVRSRDIVTVLTLGISVILPAELLTDADIAFVEGHGEAPLHPTRAAGPSLPLALEVTPAVQAQLVRSTTRVITTSADFLMPYVAGLMLVDFSAVARSWLFAAVTTAFCLACVLPGLSRLGAIPFN